MLGPTPTPRHRSPYRLRLLCAVILGLLGMQVATVCDMAVGEGRDMSGTSSAFATALDVATPTSVDAVPMTKSDGDGSIVKSCASVMACAAVLLGLGLLRLASRQAGRERGWATYRFATRPRLLPKPPRPFLLSPVRLSTLRC